MYGVGVREQLEGRSARYGHAFQLGAGLSAYTSFNLATLAGALLGSTLAETDALGLDFVFPLMFLALLVPLLSTRAEAVESQHDASPWRSRPASWPCPSGGSSRPGRRSSSPSSAPRS